MMLSNLFCIYKVICVDNYNRSSLSNDLNVCSTDIALIRINIGIQQHVLYWPKQSIEHVSVFQYISGKELYLYFKLIRPSNLYLVALFIPIHNIYVD